WREGAMAAGLVFLRWPPHWCGTVALRRPRSNTLKMFQTCGSATLLESGRTINAREGSDDHPSAALPLLPRKRYCQTWAVAGGEAALSVQYLPRRAWTYLSPRLFLRRAITCGQAADRR